MTPKLIVYLDHLLKNSFTPMKINVDIDKVSPIHIEGVALMLIVAFALLELWIEQGYVASLVLTNIEKRGGF